MKKYIIESVSDNTITFIETTEQIIKQEKIPKEFVFNFTHIEDYVEMKESVIIKRK